MCHFSSGEKFEKPTKVNIHVDGNVNDQLFSRLQDLHQRQGKIIIFWRHMTTEKICLKGVRRVATPPPRDSNRNLKRSFMKLLYDVYYSCPTLPTSSKKDQPIRKKDAVMWLLDKICWLKWSRLHWTIAFEKIDLELILVRWHGNSGLVAFMDVTFICCEPNVLPCYWDVEPSPFCDPSLWCFVTEAFWEKKNTIADLPTFKDGAFPISVWMYPACVTKKKTQTKT